jgi:hypothetical protein
MVNENYSIFMFYDENRLILYALDLSLFFFVLSEADLFWNSDTFFKRSYIVLIHN